MEGRVEGQNFEFCRCFLPWRKGPKTEKNKEGLGMMDKAFNSWFWDGEVVQFPCYEVAVFVVLFCSVCFGDFFLIF
ncbi:hypothetical protein L211DRAFT_579404 [Terfezia boudieri ATCC MYA-4762]|uniref:Transmembrane protein n=1 Tax=Terfezia boudieri ATCC MYA-4762 TaxID=1051890 RepID=A0A3N4LAN3_9PEZI|nr:hypothetical protein L211DRAFT_579404 [Terfezia boudieri ATCC MYA-4762]